MKELLKVDRSPSRLYEALHDIIRVTAATIEARDPYTAGHQQRVANLSAAIAKEIQLSERQIEGIRMAGIVHDIGKVHVPFEILTKPSRFDEVEFNVIKRHPQTGYNIFKDIELPWPVAQVILHHHERMNGSGYPSGASGKDILMESRILAVADVVEAMASHRPYRPALGIDKALEEITQNRAILYDADVVDACVKVFNEEGFEFRPVY